MSTLTLFCKFTINRYFQGVFYVREANEPPMSRMGIVGCEVHPHTSELELVDAFVAFVVRFGFFPAHFFLLSFPLCQPHPPPPPPPLKNK